MSTKEDVLVSIVMAEYNTEPSQFFSSIDSILAQTYKNFELIIIDDCGRNDVAELVKRYNDSRIKVYKNEKNLGLALSLNKAVNLSLGDYIIRMDTDDIAFPERLSKQINFAKSHPEYSIIGSRYILFDENIEFGESHNHGVIKKEAFLKGTPFAHPTLLIHKKDLIDSGLYPNYKRAQDYAMEMQMYEKGYCGYIMDDVLLKYRQDKNGYKKKKYKNRVLEYKIRKKYFKLLGFSWYQRLYRFKPLIVGLIPKNMLKKYHENKVKE